MSVQVIVGTRGLKELQQAMDRAPSQVMKAVDGAVGRAAQEVARKAKDLAPKADSTLANSIRASRMTLGTWMASANTRHAEAVEAGTRGGGAPPLQTLMDWIKRKGITPRQASTTPRDLAHMIRRQIFRTGTPAQEYMKPALDALRARIGQLIADGVKRGLEPAK